MLISLIGIGIGVAITVAIVAVIFLVTCMRMHGRWKSNGSRFGPRWDKDKDGIGELDNSHPHDLRPEILTMRGSDRADACNLLYAL